MKEPVLKDGILRLEDGFDMRDRHSFNTLLYKSVLLNSTIYWSSKLRSLSDESSFIGIAEPVRKDGSRVEVELHEEDNPKLFVHPIMFFKDRTLVDKKLVRGNAPIILCRAFQILLRCHDVSQSKDLKRIVFRKMSDYFGLEEIHPIILIESSDNLTDNSVTYYLPDGISSDVGLRIMVDSFFKSVMYLTQLFSETNIVEFNLGVMKGS